MLEHRKLTRVTFMLLVMLLTTTMAWAQEAQIYAGFTADDGSGGYANEGYANLVDGKFTSNSWTKWGTDSRNVPSGETEAYYWVDFHADEAISVGKYILTTGNDNTQYSNRNPKTWILKGKAKEDDSWTTIATVKNDETMQDKDFENYEFALDKPGSYKYFRFMVEETHGDSFMQLCELRFKAPEDPMDLCAATINGIDSRYSYTGKAISIAPVVIPFCGTTALQEGVDYVTELKNSKNEVVNKTDGVYKVTEKDNYTLTIKAVI